MLAVGDIDAHQLKHQDDCGKYAVGWNRGIGRYRRNWWFWWNRGYWFYWWDRRYRRRRWDRWLWRNRRYRRYWRNRRVRWSRSDWPDRTNGANRGHWWDRRNRGHWCKRGGRCKRKTPNWPTVVHAQMVDEPRTSCDDHCQFSRSGNL